MGEHTLKVENLNIAYQTKSGYFPAVSGLSFTVYPGEVFGVVGESGSGKSTMCMGLLRLLPESARCDAERLDFDGRDLTAVKDSAFRKVRWEQISYIPQSAMNTLNPVRKIGRQFWDTILDHDGRQSKQTLRSRVDEALLRVNLPPEVADQYPHQLSGGMKQRICIAMATLLTPKLIIADEPTSALDVISQRTVLEILAQTRGEIGAAMIMIGHDMALQAQIADRIGIMYAGYFVEIGPVRSIFEHPVHPYTRGLIKAIPSVRKKQNIHTMAEMELSQEERERYRTPRPLKEVARGHFVADFS